MTTSTSAGSLPGDRRLTLIASLRPAALDARRGVVRLHPEVFAALGIEPGTPVLLTGARTTAGVAVPGGESARGLLLADDLMLGNLRVSDGAAVSVEPVPLRPARSVTVAGEPHVEAAISPEMLRLALLGKAVTVDDNVSLLPQDVAPTHHQRPLVEAARQSLATRMGFGWTTTLLTVVDADPPRAALVTTDTVVRWRNGHQTPQTPDALHTALAEAAKPGQPGAVPAVEDLVGLHEAATRLTELLDLAYHHQEVLRRLGTTVQLGVLISGPAGSGKTTLVQAVAADLEAKVFPVSGSHLAVLTPDAAAGALRDALSAARQESPALLLVTDVDALAARDQPGPLGTVLRQVIGEATGAGVAVVCTTSHPEAVDPALRRPGVLDHELVVELPDTSQRRQLLDVLTRAMPLADDVSLDEVASRTPGFVTADLLALVREAGVRAAMRQREEAMPEVIQADFDAALEVVQPTSMASSTLEVATVTFEDVGDMTEVKEVLTEAVLWPLRYPDTFARLGVDPPRGVLLYGPPGCGKTFLVKALAGTGEANVLAVKGAELLSKWVGESERAVRELFRHARQAAPTLVFLDEIDALAPVRGQATDGGTTDRVVASLLTELDGVEELRDVVVVGATNRPDLIDPALLRPGRLEKLIFVPPPNAEARAEILRAVARKVPLAEDVDLTGLSAELEGFSAADCAALIREAALTAMRESLDSAEVSMAHLSLARKRVQPSLDPVQVMHLAAFAAERDLR